MVLSLGYNGYVLVEQVDAILPYDSDPVKKFCAELEKANKIVKVTRGREARSVVVMKSGNAFISAVDAGTLATRLQPHT